MSQTTSPALVPEERVDLLAAIHARRFSAGMKAALVRVLDGDTYRNAAASEGVGYREVRRNAGTVTGLLLAHKRAWHKGWGGALPAFVAAPRPRPGRSGLTATRGESD